MGITRINNNISALTAQRNIERVGGSLQQSIERLSSGLRINRAADDAAGLVISNRLRSQVEGLNQAVDNASTGINVLNVAEGSLEETSVRLNRIRELSVQAANTGVNDFKSRLAIQDEVAQSIDEVTRIASTTKFAGNFLLNGDFSIKSELKTGQDFYGVNIDASAVASNLNSGTQFLNIRQTQVGRSEIVAGDIIGGQQVVSTGIQNQTDIAVSLARFSSAQFIDGAAALAATALTDAFFNGISVSSAGNLAVVTFSGSLSNGSTSYNGTLTLAAASTVNNLVSSINSAIDAAERAFFGTSTNGSIPTSFRTTATLGAGANGGRILLVSSGNFFNQSDLNVAVLRNNAIAAQSNGVSRSGEIGASSTITGQGSIGNNVTAITGSTFSTGEFNITVDDAQAAQQRIVESTIVFRDNNGGIISRSVSLDTTTSTRTLVLNGTFEGAVFTGGTTLNDGDTITLLGTTSNGTTFSSTFTYDISTVAVDVDSATELDDFRFASISGLIEELNYRTRIYDAAATGASNGEQTRFEDAIFTFSANGTLALVDDIGKSNSQTDFTLTFNAASGPTTLQDNAALVQEGYAEQATFRFSGGDAIRAEAGDVITLEAAESTIIGVPTAQVTLRVGNGFTAGTDTLINVENKFVGTLNGGEGVTFGAGEQDVVFFTPGSNTEPSRFLTIDFDAVVDATKGVGLNDAGTTVLISTVNRGLNFQIGSDAGQNIQFTVGDLRADNLGFGRGSGRTVQDIDITSLTGAEEAITIIDEALEQVNRTRSILGAATNRLDAAISNLSVASENLTASESRIRDADIAAETSRFTLNQVLLQAGTSVLAQANFQSQGFLSLLG